MTTSNSDLALELSKLKSTRDTLLHKAAKSEGQLKALMDELERDHGCSTLEQAEKKIKRLKTLCERKRTKYNLLLREAKHEQRKYDDV